MIKKRILVVDDDDHLRQGLEVNLLAEDYHVLTSGEGLDALSKAKNEKVDLILLDVNLPGMDGFEICRLLREDGFRMPVLMLTARGEEDDRILGLEAGADDYVIKPFSLHELLARIHALLRRRQWDESVDHKIKREESLLDGFGPFKINWETSMVTSPQKEIQLTQQEVKLLKYFLKRPGKIIARGELLFEVWGYDPTSPSRTIDAFMNRFRKYFHLEGDYPEHFVTLRGVGFRFDP